MEKDESSAAAALFSTLNYLSAAILYLNDDILLERPLTAADLKQPPLGHWGTAPAQNLVWAGLDQLFRAYDTSALVVQGPGHGGQVALLNSFLEGSYTHAYPEVPQTKAGLTTLFRRFATLHHATHPGPDVPGTIQTGGELGYTLAHAAGAVLDAPGTRAVALIGDGEAETGPLAASWQVSRLLRPGHDGAVFPIILRNGFAMDSPTVLSQMAPEAINAYFDAQGWAPLWVALTPGEDIHHALYLALARAWDMMTAWQKGQDQHLPVLILTTPKGWTGPEAGEAASHQLPVTIDPADPEAGLAALTRWLQPQRPQHLFAADGTLGDAFLSLLPPKARRITNYPAAHHHFHRWRLPELADRPVPKRGATKTSPTAVLGTYLDSLAPEHRLHLFSPDELGSVHLADLHQPTTANVVSEHLDEGLLEGYTLTGRQGLFTSYEAFLPIVGSMVAQHGKWLQEAQRFQWRDTEPSLNLMATGDVWEQGHNGYSHQNPLMQDIVASLPASTAQIYLPADTNMLLASAHRALRGQHTVNLLVASKSPQPDWFRTDEAAHLVKAGIDTVRWASTHPDETPDVVLLAGGMVPFGETLGAVRLLAAADPALAIRVVYLARPLVLRSSEADPNGLAQSTFDQLFPAGVPVVAAYAGYPALLASLLYTRGHAAFDLHGFNNQGGVTTPAGLAALNGIDQDSLAAAAYRTLGRPVPAAWTAAYRRHFSPEWPLSPLPKQVE
ncbi:hypothetical protein [Schleiferilactobacillus shenzhenensis]|uniref:Phosphoketolase n=1 Tax=Schleiferilactobacillus shenzhenensis LY-73 TaxID=1231336 RepID=U4TIU7_9LACO|nr:hypothetical protein [Schleiferilactobacillus shenzhenensis]ERL64741.1 hypothetical protein L248_0660 [Schleiferilactobacillus shenzhenensis LY-73]